MLSIPECLVFDQLIKRAEKVEIYKFLDYYIIVNNLNPLTFLYEDTNESNKRYIWITQKYYRKQLVRFIQ